VKNFRKRKRDPASSRMNGITKKEEAGINGSSFLFATETGSKDDIFAPWGHKMT
jgi:hypothetical protein